MNSNFVTSRLSLQLLSTADAEFIYELVNSSGWLEFIGDRNVKSVSDGLNYIKKINDNKNVTYWTVKLKVDETAIGVITFIKREYLDYYDIGFAFLPQFSKNGYAFEAAKVVLDNALSNSLYPVILASTLPQNINSIGLLKKLGLHFERELQIGNEKLLIFSTEKKG